MTLRKASLSTLFILNRPVLMQNSVDTDENASTDSLYIDIFCQTAAFYVTLTTLWADTADDIFMDFFNN